MLRVRAAAALALAATICAGQDFHKPVRQYVSYIAEAQMVPADKPAMLQVRFHVQQGFHVNSHKPRSEFLLATRLDLQPSAGLKPGTLIYPTGKEFRFSFSPTEPLDVYSEDFTVAVPVTASAGAHTVSASLVYQACDQAACYPPRTLPVEVTFMAQ